MWDKEQLLILLKNHDWSYSYSDDHRVWQRGSDSLYKLKTILQEVKENQPDLINVVKEFYEKNVTEEFRKQFCGSAGFYSVLEQYFN
jgi:hypothetical protein